MEAANTYIHIFFNLFQTSLYNAVYLVLQLLFHLHALIFFNPFEDGFTRKKLVAE